MTEEEGHGNGKHGGDGGQADKIVMLAKASIFRKDLPSSP